MKIKDDLGKSIRSKLFYTLSISIILIILVLVFTNSIVLKTFYTYSKVFSAKDAFEEINNQYDTNIFTFTDSLNKIATKNNFEILVENDSNLILYSTSQTFTNIINKNISQILVNTKKDKKILYAKPNMVVRKVSINGLSYILLSGKLNNGCNIYIQISIAAIEESVKISNTILLIMGALVTLISAIIASIISRKFTSPILQLNKIANKMANLDFSEKYVETNSNDEINELGESINKMSDKLKITIKQLRSNNNQLEKDIEEKSKIDEMRKQFISDVSHELKTPIALIQGYAEGLVENVNTDPESKKYYAEVILDESNKMDKLVRQLLELMRIEYGKIKFNDSEFNICELIQEVIRKCNVMAEEKGAKIEFENKEAIDVLADEFYIDQAFTNYLTNAIKHVKKVNDDSKIIIKTSIENNNKVKVSVFNTGDPIPEENLEKIWGRFYKIDTSRNRADGGSGIGLSLVKAIMTNYNEKYGVVNKEDGVEFYFYMQLSNKKIDNKKQ